MARISFARVLVEVDATKPLVREIALKLPNGRMLHQKVLFEREPKLCTNCRMIGHDATACKGKQPLRRSRSKSRAAYRAPVETQTQQKPREEMEGNGHPKEPEKQNSLRAPTQVRKERSRSRSLAGPKQQVEVVAESQPNMHPEGQSGRIQKQLSKAHQQPVTSEGSITKAVDKGKAPLVVEDVEEDPKLAMTDTEDEMIPALGEETTKLKLVTKYDTISQKRPSKTKSQSKKKGAGLARHRV